MAGASGSRRGTEDEQIIPPYHVHLSAERLLLLKACISIGYETGSIASSRSALHTAPIST